MIRHRFCAVLVTFTALEIGPVIGGASLPYDVRWRGLGATIRGRAAFAAPKRAGNVFVYYCARL